LEILKEKILVIQTAFLGDSVLTLPMIQKLKEDIPNSEISVLCIPSSSELFKYSPIVDDVIVYDKHGSQKSFWSFIKVIKLLRNKNFDRIYSPHRSLRSSLMVFSSGARITVGFDNAGWSFLYKKRMKYFSDKHEVARNLDLIGYDTRKYDWKIVPKINIQKKVEQKIQKICEEIGMKKLIAIAPGSVWNTKVYPKEYFIDLIENFIAQNYFVVLIGGTEDKLLCDEIRGKFSSNVRFFAGILSVIESIALIKKCSLLISNDSAPTHLGMISDIPVLTIYCSTVPSFGFYPYNSKSKFISFDDLKCKPCGIHGYNECPIKTFECGYKLLPQNVISAIKEMNAH